MQSIEHPHLVKCEDAFEHLGKLHIVMEECPGGNWTDLIEKSKKSETPVPEERVLEMAA